MGKVSVWVDGTPAPGGSKNVRVMKYADGSSRTIIWDAGKNNAKWKRLVTLKALAVCSAQGLTRPVFPAGTPLRAQFSFLMPKPKRPKSGNPTVKPDITKLVRAAEDALTGVLWADDAQIVEQTASKAYADACPGMLVTVEALQR